MTLVLAIALSLSLAGAQVADRMAAPGNEAPGSAGASPQTAATAREGRKLPLNPEGTVGNIVNVECDLKVQRAGEMYSVKAVPAQVLMGDRLLCNGEGVANIEFSSGALLEIGSDTDLTIQRVFIERHGRDIVGLAIGTLSTSFRFGQALMGGKTRFEVMTPTGTIGVRGTVFKVKVPRDPRADEVVETTEGEVSVKNRHGAERLVKAGFFVTLARSGKISRPIPLGARKQTR